MEPLVFPNWEPEPTVNRDGDQRGQKPKIAVLLKPR